MDEPSLPRLTYPPRGPSCYSQAGHALDDHFLHKYYYIYIYTFAYSLGRNIDMLPAAAPRPARLPTI